MKNKTIFYNLSVEKSFYFSSYLSSFPEIKRISVESSGQAGFFFMLNDLTAMKNLKNGLDLSENIKNGIASFLINGMSYSNRNINIFCESSVMNHTVLAWFFSFVSNAEYHDLLAVSDILMYNTDCIVADICQIKNAQLSIMIAEAFNSRYGSNIFKVPEVLLNNMNRSGGAEDIDNFFEVFLTDSNDIIMEKIFGSNISSKIVYDYDKNPYESRIVNIFSFLTKMTVNDVVSNYKSKDISDFKKELVDSTVSYLAPIRHEIEKLKKDTAYLMNVLKSGNQKALFISNSIIEKVKNIVMRY